MPIKVVCDSCGHVLYVMERGNMKSIIDVLRMYDYRCPCCLSKLSSVPLGFEIFIVEKKNGETIYEKVDVDNSVENGSSKIPPISIADIPQEYRDTVRKIVKHIVDNWRSFAYVDNPNCGEVSSVKIRKMFNIDREYIYDMVIGALQVVGFRLVDVRYSSNNGRVAILCKE